jgi:coenzyme Q-binding protein COQ10
MPTHAEKRAACRTRPEQLFALVAQVDRYRSFFPRLAARIRQRDETLVADLVIGFKMIRERFTSRVTLAHRPRRIDVRYADGPFRHLENHGLQLAAPSAELPSGGTLIDFYVDFEQYVTERSTSTKHYVLL